jgi:diaminohydroxyphosphoribosylaminopyrimidine deaminase/5-amino-6-(5-phosphoribosylamino)uracil reductase
MNDRIRVILKLAVSLDGRIAARTGASRWITGPAARARVHALRAANDAIGVGIGTALADDPELTVRDAPGRDPVRVVFDSRLRLPPASKLALTARRTRTIAIAAENAPRAAQGELESRGVEVIRVATEEGGGRIDLAAGLLALTQAGLSSILVEGGAAIAGALLAGRLANELHVFVAPILLGPEGRPCVVAWQGPAQPGDAPRIAQPIVEMCGSDVYVRGTLEFPASLTAPEAAART